MWKCFNIVRWVVNSVCRWLGSTHHSLGFLQMHWILSGMQITGFWRNSLPNYVSLHFVQKIIVAGGRARTRVLPIRSLTLYYLSYWGFCYRPRKSWSLYSTTIKLCIFVCKKMGKAGQGYCTVYTLEISPSLESRWLEVLIFLIEWWPQYMFLLVSY